MGDEATQMDLRPNDSIEWMPFIKAYAYLGDKERASDLASILKDDPYYRHQICKEISLDSYHMAERFPDGQLLLVSEFCQPGSE